MEAHTQDLDQMIQQLNQFILPSSLMESFDAYREESASSAARAFSDVRLASFLDMMNRFRGLKDRKNSLLDIFDPGMYTWGHPAWKAAPGTRIEMPALTSAVAEDADRDPEFAKVASEEIEKFRNHAGSCGDQEILGLARIAAAALADQGRVFQGREEALRYLALNASAELEDLWATDDILWEQAPPRHIQFGDMVAKRKAALLKPEWVRPSFE
jgi:hypothetical protein